MQIFMASNLLVHKMNTIKYYSQEMKAWQEEKLRFANLVSTMEWRLQIMIDIVLKDYNYIGENIKEQIKNGEIIKRLIYFLRCFSIENEF